MKHERRVVSHLSGRIEALDTCVCGKPWPCDELYRLTFQHFRKVNWARAQHWHAGKPWSASDWMTALVGEVGEAANVIKKLNRIRDGLPGNRAGVTAESLRADLANELADCQIYLDLLAAAVGVDLAQATRAKFNEVSERLGFEEKL